MPQVVQDVRTGTLSLVQGESPRAQPNRVVIANRASVISAGTEKMLMQFANKGLLAKARERPDQVRRVLEKVQTEGVQETVRQVREKLDQPLPLGYSSAGVVIACGENVQGFRVGDRVASNGPHASVVSVPENLVARLPDQVDFDRASFAVLGSIALQGVRLSRCVLGETALVIGLGLVGQMTVALLRAAGCRVFGTDPDPRKCELAVQGGAEVAVPGLSAKRVEQLTGDLGADSVLITASTSSNGPIELACDAVRPKGRIVLVGVVGLEMPRRPMYFKEAEFVVSCSYGPGRYDANYEERGIDYPAAHVRWTEQRNIQAVLDLIGTGAVKVEHLISHRFPVDQAEHAYQMIREGTEPYVAVILEYENDEAATFDNQPVTMVSTHPAYSQSCNANRLGAPETSVKQLDKTIEHPRIAVVGVGNFATMTMLPAIRKADVFEPGTLCSAGGLSATIAAKKFGYANVTTKDRQVIEDPDTDAVFILTRHDLHADQICRAIEGGKHVLVEKPMALTETEVARIRETVRLNPERVLTVGYNRRYSQAAELAKQHFRDVVAPLTVQYRFNAGSIPADCWIQNAAEGGGRIIGEACHAIDLATFLSGSHPVEVYATSIGGTTAPAITDDQCFITLRHANGSISNIGYLAGGDRGLAKERIEILGGGRSCVIDDFKRVECYARGRRKVTKTRGGKGHREEVIAFAKAIQSGKWPIDWMSLEATARCAIGAVTSLRLGRVVRLETTPLSEKQAA